MLLVVADIVMLFKHRRKPLPVFEASRFQIWIQDMLVLSVGFMFALALGFDRVNWQTLVIPAISVILGFVAAVDVCSTYKGLTPISRAFVCVVIMSGFILGVWLFSTLWFFWKRGRAWRLKQRCADRGAFVIASVVVLIYTVAFALPMDKKEFFGFFAYIFSFSTFFSAMEKDELSLPALAWLANPCLWISLAFLLEGRHRMAAAFAFSAAGLALTVNVGDPYTIFNSPAYGTWFFSMALLSVLALASMIAHSRERIQKPMQ